MTTTHRVVSGVLYLFLLFNDGIAQAGEAKGKVTNATESKVTAIFDIANVVKVGNEATVALQVEGVGLVPITGTWRVEEIVDTKVVLRPLSSGNDQPLPDQIVIIADTDKIIAGNKLIGNKHLSAPGLPKQPTTVSTEAGHKKLSEADIIYIQQMLNRLGYDAGMPDGAVGPRTRSAIRQFQKDAGLRVNGQISPQLENALATAKSKSGGNSKPTLLGETPPLAPAVKVSLRPPEPQSTGEMLDPRTTEELNNDAQNYYFGQNGRPQDYKKYYELSQIAASRGNPEAIYCLGVAHHLGHGVVKDDNKAYGYFERAAKKGHSKAAFNIAVMRHRGFGVERDDSMAMNYMRQAVASNNPAMFFAMGTYHYNGVGVEKSHEKAIDWFRKGARQGDEKCKEALREMKMDW
jgi:peptidoglycan hydrolase-like protein with peptidoglycan-binding domain